MHAVVDCSLFVHAVVPSYALNMVSLKMAWRPKFGFRDKRKLLFLACYRGQSNEPAQSYENIGKKWNNGNAAVEEKRKAVKVEVGSF